jgi:EcsC protein family
MGWLDRLRLAHVSEKRHIVTMQPNQVVPHGAPNEGAESEGAQAVALRQDAVLTPEDAAALARAVQTLEHPGFAARLTNLVGRPIEFVARALPAPASQYISKATSKALELALKVALKSMEDTPHARSRLMHKALATVSGATGGAFGLPALAVELPFSTIVILRSIADIARREGENLSDPEVTLACLQVFALGGRSGSDDATESGYFAVRGMLAKTITEATRFIAERGLVEEGAPVLVRLISQVASRFGAVVTQKVAAQAVPVVGALGGGAVNYVFIEHFQEMAQGHFTVRRLERRYGKELVRQEYDRLARPPG